MKQPINEIEKLLAQRLVDAPASLKADVESTIAERLRIQTRHDDMKWLAISFGALLLSIGLSFALLTTAGQQARDLSNHTLTETDDGHRIAKLLLRNVYSEPQPEL